MALSIELSEYEALVALARRGAATDHDLRSLDSFLQSIEKKNKIIRSKLWVLWQEMSQPLPPTTEFPRVWPPEQKVYMELTTRPIARSDVEVLLAARAKRPINVLVTPDPAGLVGWSTLDSYFLT